MTTTAVPWSFVPTLQVRVRPSAEIPDCGTTPVVRHRSGIEEIRPFVAVVVKVTLSTGLFE
ncbi:hypothetical protein, partial [Arthrobacter sp. NamB2]|uniref:hypothetical protein n=1 Tax=Arthrobacter sp. NamB2 TaxID=2576035 RepID=UPI001CB8C59F